MSAGTPCVAIIGGGISGWLVAYFLAEQGITSTVYDTDPCSGYSSTRNQGWLHSGAFYVALEDDPGVAEACRDGSNWFQQFIGGATGKGVPGYYIFEDIQERDRVVRVCNSLGIFAQPANFAALLQAEPILDSPLQPATCAAVVNDHSIDTGLILRRLVDDACHTGARFNRVVRWDQLQIDWQQTHWDVGYQGSTMDSFDAVVLACGPYIPELLRTVVPNGPTHAASLQVKVDKIPVLVLRDSALAQSLIAIPKQLGAPQVVPFNNALGRGVTICLHRRDVSASSANDHAFPPYYEDDFLQGLTRWLGGLARVIGAQQISAHSYTCHKLGLVLPGGNVTRTGVLQPLAPDGQTTDKSLFVIYPGKFSAAPVIARECANQIKQLLGDPSQGPLTAVPTSLAVAQHPYHNLTTPPQFGLRVAFNSPLGNQQLEFL